MPAKSKSERMRMASMSHNLVWRGKFLLGRRYLQESTADQEEPYRIQGPGDRHEDDARNGQEEPEHDVSEIQAMHYDAQVCRDSAEDAAPKHNDGDQYGASLHEHSAENRTGPVPNIGG